MQLISAATTTITFPFQRYNVSSSTADFTFIVLRKYLT